MRRCGDCGIWKANREVCPYFQEHMDKDELGCPKFQSELNTCQICGRPYLGKAVINYDTHSSATYVVCPSCDANMYTCGTCKMVTVCDFETNPVPLEKYVQQEIRQGNMVAVTTVKNPERIRETCQKNCKCFSQEFGCMKTNNECGNWECVK